MKRIIFYNNDLLAAEYVIGTLQGLARRRYQCYLESYPELKHAVDHWQNDLGELTETLPEAQPAADLWLGIKEKL